MGCSNSKSTDTDNQKKPEDKPSEEWITVEEAEGYVQKEMGVSEEIAKKVVDKINKNDDGKVSNAELIELWNKVKESKEQIEPMFKDADKDGSGKVSTEEAVDVMKKKFDGIPENQLTAMVQRLDTDDSKTINYNEFVLVYCHIKAKKEKIMEQFDTLDKDGNGKLPKDDLISMLKQEMMVYESFAASIVEDFEMNKDGVIDKTEFTNFMSKFFA